MSIFKKNTEKHTNKLPTVTWSMFRCKAHMSRS